MRHKRRDVSPHTPKPLIRKINMMEAERKMEERRRGIKDKKKQGVMVVKGRNWTARKEEEGRRRVIKSIKISSSR